MRILTKTNLEKHYFKDRTAFNNIFLISDFLISLILNQQKMYKLQTPLKVTVSEWQADSFSASQKHLWAQLGLVNQRLQLQLTLQGSSIAKLSRLRGRAGYGE